MALNKIHLWRDVSLACLPAWHWGLQLCLFGWWWKSSIICDDKKYTRWIAPTHFMRNSQYDSSISCWEAALDAKSMLLYTTWKMRLKTPSTPSMTHLIIRTENTGPFRYLQQEARIRWSGWVTCMRRYSSKPTAHSTILFLVQFAAFWPLWITQYSSLAMWLNLSSICSP